jgi:hypothetical protein
MNTLSVAEIKQLMKAYQPPCISMFLPIHHGPGSAIWQDQQRLRNLLRAARPSARRFTDAHLAALWKPIEALLARRETWLEPGDGLAIFRSPQFFSFYPLPYDVREQGMVSNHFYLKPLLPLLTNEKSFYLLALSQNEVRLFKGTHYGITELALPPSVPTSLAAVTKEKASAADYELEYHSSTARTSSGKGGRRPVIFHGQGGDCEEEKRQLLRYFQKINRGLHEILADETAPLVLASAEFLWPIYRQANTYPHLLPGGVAGNPDRQRVSARMLHSRAWPLVEAWVLKEQDLAFARFVQEQGSELISENASEIIPAACQGRVKDLFVASNQELWGTYDQATMTLNIHEVARASDEDLLDLAARQTLLHGGAVYALTRANMPAAALLASCYRY